jgi:hypothetical protein
MRANLGVVMSVPMPVKSGNLLRFDRLDTSGFSIPVFTVGWRITDEPNDKWTKRFLAFKADHRKGFMGGAFLMREAVRELIVDRGIAQARPGIAIALSSADSGIQTGSVLFRTGDWIANQLDLPFVGSYFTKKPHRSLHSLTSSSDRDNEVRNKYVCGKIPGIKNLIILDDFVTRGATFLEMKRALDISTPGLGIFGLALGKNERTSYASRFGHVISNSHIPESWNEVWVENAKRGEQ